MYTLTENAQRYITEKNISLTRKEKGLLSCYTPAKQMQWLVNPKVSYLLELYNNSTWKNIHSNISSETSNNVLENITGND